MLTTSSQVISSGRTRSVISTDRRRATSRSVICAMDLPSSQTVPRIRLSCLMMLFKIVDLPEPLGPIRVRISPRRMWRLISSISALPP